MNVVLVSAAWPYRGGIAQYTAKLYQELKARGHGVGIVNFTSQYPKWIVKNQYAEDERFKVPSERMLNPVNPLSWIRVAKLIRLVDCVIFKYWHPWFALCFGFVGWACKLSMTPVTFIVDNLTPHEWFPFARLLTKFALSSATGIVVQSGAVEKELNELVPKCAKIAED